MQGTEHIDHIALALQSGNCAMISDGSFDPSISQAAGAWCIGNEALHRLLTGQSPCTGQKTSHSAYRGELAALYGGMMCIKLLCEYKNITTGRILIGCDGLGALKKIQTTTTPLSTKHFDYVSSLQMIIKEIPLSIQFIHVKGHQDASIDMEQLSVVEQMNVLADTLAKQANSRLTHDNRTANLPLFKELGPLFLSNGITQTKLTSQLQHSLYSELTKYPTRSYWQKKMTIPSSYSPTIAWDAISSAFTSLSSTKQTEVIKWNSEFCGTGKNLRQWKEQQHSACPTCGVENENTHHILTCPHPTATAQWKQSVRSLENWLIQQSTHPDVTRIIIENLHSWHDNRPPSTITDHIHSLLPPNHTSLI